MAKNVKRWFVETTKAESWDGKNGAPNVWFNSYKMDSLEAAREFIQRQIGEIAMDPKNKVEWIGWTTTKVEVRHNYPNEGAGKVHVNFIMAILYVDENGVIKYVDIGD